MKALSATEAKANLSEIYHAHFDEVIGGFLGGSESVIFAADCSIASFGQGYVGFLIVTSIRLVAVTYLENQIKTFGARKRIRYKKEYGRASYWFSRPLAPLSPGELKKREINEFALKTWDQIHHKEYPIRNSEADESSIIELQIYGSRAFARTDGDRLYSLLLEAMRSEGRLDVEKSETDYLQIPKNWISELERLRTLHSEGALSDDQFERAKLKLLGS